MQTRYLAIALVLATSTPFVIGGAGCGGTSARTGTGGKDGGAGTGAAGSTAGTGAAGSTAGATGAAGSTAGATGAAGMDAAAGTGAGGMDAAAGSDGGTDVMDASIEPLPPPPPDGANQMSWTFPADLMGWHYTKYGSTPTPDSPINLAFTSMLVWDGTNDADGSATSGSIKGTVPFTHTNERIDFQAFSMAPFLHDWTGYIVKAKVKLVSGGNLKAGCPLRAFLYVSGSALEGYMTPTAAPTDLVTGSWVSLTFDMADAGANVAAMVSQMGIQIETGGDCAGTAPDGGADGGTDAVVDAATEAATDAADGGASDAAAEAASDAGTDLLVDAGLGDVIDAVATDADIDASDASDAPPPPPITAGTAVILIDNVTALLK